MSHLIVFVTRCVKGWAVEKGAGEVSVIFRGQSPSGNAPYRVMSTFSGIGAASISWNSGDYSFIAYAEPAAFPSHVLHYRRGASRPKYFPSGFNPNDYESLPETGIPNFGDITQITDADLRGLGHVDILEGGSPCQAFSIAGARAGLNDPRGNLLLSFCQLAERMRKINGLEFVVWENVHGVLSDKTNGFGCLLASLAGEEGGALQPPGAKWTNSGHVLGPEGREVAWRTVEASLWGIPQRRKRVFVVANIGTTFHGFGSPGDILFEPEVSSWNLTQGLHTRQAVVDTYRGDQGFEYCSAEERLRDPAVIARLEAEASKDWIGTGLTGAEDTFAIDMKSHPAIDRTAYALTARNEGNPAAVAYALADDYASKASRKTAFALIAGSPNGGGRRQMVVHPQVAGTLCASGAGMSRTAGMASETDFVVVTKPGVRDERDENPENWVVRRFTPLECERLQGFPDYWTDVPFKGKLVSDAHRYKAIGNSMPCPVMAFIGYFLELHIFMRDFAQCNPDLIPKPKRGRPPKGRTPMSQAERQRQYRERVRLRENGRSGGVATVHLGPAGFGHAVQAELDQIKRLLDELCHDPGDQASAKAKQARLLTKRLEGNLRELGVTR